MHSIIADPLINEQIVLYVMGRTILSLVPRLYSSTASAPALPFSPLPHPLPALTSAAANPRSIPPANLPFSIVAAMSWAGVMYMFRHRAERLQPGMGSSMSESTMHAKAHVRILVPRFGSLERSADVTVAQQVVRVCILSINLGENEGSQSIYNQRVRFGTYDRHLRDLRLSSLPKCTSRPGLFLRPRGIEMLKYGRILLTSRDY